MSAHVVKVMWSYVWLTLLDQPKRKSSNRRSYLTHRAHAKKNHAAM